MEPRVCVLLLLCAALCTAEVMEDCCLSVADKRLPLKLILSYKVQEAGLGCDISATVFLVKGGKQLCLPHPEGHTRVRALIKMVDQRVSNSSGMTSA